MKKISIILALMLSLTMAFTACGKDVDSSASGDDSSSSDSAQISGGTDGDSDSDSPSDASGSTDSGDSAVDGTTAPVIIINDANTTTTAVQEYTKVRYAYSSLSAKEKKNYEAIMNAVSNFKSQVTFESPLTFDEYFKVFALVYFQEPQLFWMRGTYETFDGTRQTVILDYYCSEEEAKTKQAEIDAKVAEIKKQIPAGASTYDKLKVFHDYVVLHDSFTKDGTYPQTIYGGLVEGSVQCEGYAKTIGYLCDKFQIENMLKTGLNVKQLSHAWNIVKVDGDWYNFDTTFDDPVGNFPTDYIRYNYFLVTDAEIYNKSHFNDVAYYNPPACTATKANYFVKNNLVAATKDEGISMLKSEMLKAANSKEKYVQIKCKSLDVLNSINTELVTNKAIYTLKDDVNKSAKNKVNITAAPALDNGVLTIQITLNY